MPEHEGTPALELWGGFECTVNRVGDRWRSQLERSGHVRRLSDLDAVAALGIRTLRYPLSWEVLAPERLDEIDWRAADERMARIRALGIRPIVGLVHHGSGPRYTRLDAPSFAPGLARLAFEVANRYPWVDSFTPVNEPLTTARFSGLYGHWFPHLTSASAFTRCLYNQCLATALAMRAIRSVRPDARLIQTDDLGRIHSTDRLRYQADFENERRWLSWDLLSGRVSREHPLYRHLLDSGLTEGELAVFLEQPCPPQVIGVNHYGVDLILTPRSGNSCAGPAVDPA